MTCALNVLHWGARRSMDGDKPRLQDCRERFVHVWKSLYYPEYKAAPVPVNHATFWEGPRRARSIGKKLYEFFLRHQIVHLNQPYNVSVPGGRVIHGEYMEVRDYRSRTSDVLVVVAQAPSHPALPDVIGLCRWLHAAVSEAKIGIYYLPLLRGKSYRQTPTGPLVSFWLSNIIEGVRIPAPNSGPHCLHCVGQPCKVVLT